MRQHDEQAWIAAWDDEEKGQAMKFQMELEETDGQIIAAPLFVDQCLVYSLPASISVSTTFAYHCESLSLEQSIEAVQAVHPHPRPFRAAAGG